MTTLRPLIEKHLPALRALRHDLHRHPELMFEEQRTSEVVARELQALGLKSVTGIGAEAPGGATRGGTGVLALIPATTNPDRAPTVALRADMDALPILEATGKPYASTTPGLMHACGHDGHTTMLIGAARVLVETKDRPNNVILLFQPAEEGGAGADKMCRDGALDGRLLGHKADFIFGLHGWPDQPLGTVSVRPGPMLAATDDFIVTVRGKGGHAAQPHLCVDPIVVTAQIITALQTIVSRRLNPFEPVVLTVGAVHAGTVNNVIPDSAEFIGSLRTLSPEARALGEAEFKKIVVSVASAMGALADIQWNTGYPVTRNDPDATERVRRVACEAVGGDRLLVREHPTMGGEDFAYYGPHAKAAFFFLGLCPPNQGKYPGLHTPEFDFNDEAMGPGIEMLAGLALNV
jgi:amidohydrolase